MFWEVTARRSSHCDNVTIEILVKPQAFRGGKMRVCPSRAKKIFRQVAGNDLDRARRTIQFLKAGRLSD
jgi:hypothetical protein